jgi:DNA polymerase-1
VPGAPLLIADVPWLLYRSFFALPKSITDEEGRPVNALLGTVNALLRLAENVGGGERPRAVAACTGAEEAAYRVELYPPYHAHREPMPPELRRQWELAPQLLAACGWSVPGSANLEADDVMFSLARLEEEAGGSSLLFTGDRDLYGAVTAATAVVELPKSGDPTRIDEDGVRARYGVDPAQVPDLIALRGDPSDGIPGAPGIGAKTAAQLLASFGSLEDLLEAALSPISELRPRTRGALLDNEELLRNFKRIATLQRIALERPADADTDYAAAGRAARALGMKRLAERLEGL